MNRSLLAVVPAIGLSLAAAAPALAQGTSGMLPSPIAGGDLDRFADRLGLTAEQRRALDPAHEAYLDSFRVLRENEIEQYMAQVGEVWRAVFRSLDRKAVEDALSTQNRLMSKIRLLDDNLFDEMQAVLTEEQVVNLPRLMQARDRQRHRTGGTRMTGFINRAARVDLTRIYETLELTDEERQATDSFMRQYETRLTGETKDLYEASSSMFLDLLDSLQKQGVSFEDPAAAWPAMREAWAEAAKKPRDKAMEISDLNRQTVRQISEFLAAEHAAALRDRYLRRAYPEVPGAGRSSAERAFRSLLDDKSLPASQRTDLTGAATQFRAQRNQLVQESVGVIDKYRREWVPSGFGRGGGSDELDKQVEAFRQRLTRLDESTLDTLRAMLGPDYADTIRMAAATAAGDDGDAGDGDGGAGRRPGRDDDPRQALRDFAAGLGPDPLLPQPITRRDLQTYRQRLGLQDSEWFILESLHEEYVTTYSQIRGTDVAALRKAQGRVLRDDENEDGQQADQAPPTPEEIDEVYALRREALDAMRAADALFFDDVEGLIASPQQQSLVRRLRLGRDREVFNRGLGGSGPDMLFGGGGRGGRGGGGGGGRWSMGGQSREASVDLGALADALAVDGEARAELDRRLVDYEAAAADGFRRQYESALELRRRLERMRADAARRQLQERQQAQNQQGDEEERRRRWRGRFEGFREVMENQGRAAADARAFMAELNRGTLATLIEGLPAAPAQELRDAYNRAAFPSVYDDPQAAERYLSAALDLTDLTEQQRARLETIAGQYRPAHQALAEQIAAIYAQWEDASADGFNRERFQGMREQRNRLEVLEFDRGEVNSRALRNLRDVLTERQQAQVRLPEPAPAEGT